MNNECLALIEQMNISYSPPGIGKEEILSRLRQGGFRITKQRLVLLDVILESECSCCKEIYFQVHKKMPQIGVATIYRMINTLEEVGAIRRKNVYQICSHDRFSIENCVVELAGGVHICLNKDNFHRVMEEGMRCLGLTGPKAVTQVIAVNQQ